MTSTLSMLIHGPDVVIDVSIWSTVEPGIGITAASIATLRPLVQTVMWRLGLAPPPSYNATRQVGSREGARPDTQHRRRWFRPRNPVRDIAFIESSTSTSTTADPPSSRKKRRFSSRNLRLDESEQELSDNRSQIAAPARVRIADGS